MKMLLKKFILTDFQCVTKILRNEQGSLEDLTSNQTYQHGTK